MEKLLRIARKPVATNPRATVREACELMIKEAVGAVVVLDEGRLVGIFSERDVVARIVVPRRDPDTTPVSEVMTREVATANAGMTEEQVMELMHQGKFRHLPLVDASGRVTGVISIRHLLKKRVEELDTHNANLVAYMSTDGPGG
jgi:CBS domain-containing protein